MQPQKNSSPGYNGQGPCKYSRDTILNPKKIRKGHTRWNQFNEALSNIDSELLKGPILDFGFGIGYFVLEGLRRGMDMWGVDILPGKIERYRKLIEYTKSPQEWQSRCTAANGEELPFQSNQFSAISSWYVFEHIENPSQVIREMVRVTRPGGVITIRAQDARNGWEGHCKIPWIPFLSEQLAKAWIEEFGKSSELRQGVYDITQPQVVAIFEELNCIIAVQAAEPVNLIDNHWQLTTEEEIRSTARSVRQKLEDGEWRPQPENLYIFAQKR